MTKINIANAWITRESSNRRGKVSVLELHSGPQDL